MNEIENYQMTGMEIAVIGMAGRFPNSRNIAEFWEHLKNGIECISYFSDDELEDLELRPGIVKNPNYVKAKAMIEDTEYFDASFFDYSPREAEAMDPQMRIFHECAWEALESGGYDSYSYEGLIGLYLGASSHAYWEAVNSVLSKSKPSEQFAISHLTDKDFMATRISYKLNLRGPSVTMATACSTSLVAIHLACNGIIGGECDMALAGGISVWLPGKTGYLYEEGMILSDDGHNRTFDEKATGSVFGDGAGVVLLKRFDDAVADGDIIHALIKGSAINNDGNRKVGYTAPSVEGQAEVIRMALQMAEVEPESIGYLEAHGTATSLGDAVEIEALNRVFASNEKKKNSAIGSVKSNVGHLNSAAGVIGFIKTVLILKHKLIPPTMHFGKPNPKIDFKTSSFHVNTTLTEWKPGLYPLRAGISSFGIGGTNAHFILEETPGITRKSSEKKRQHLLILLSAKTGPALDIVSENLGNYLKKNPDINLADVSYTLKVGRKSLPYRKMFIGSNLDETIDALLLHKKTSFPAGSVSRKVFGAFAKEDEQTMVFMFPGLGDQYVNMGRELYEKEPLFHRQMDRCFEIVDPLLEYDIKGLLYPADKAAKNTKSLEVSHHSHSAYSIQNFEVAQLLVFIIEYSLSRMLMEWGITPQAMIGYSFGEYAAACIAGVFSLEDALKLVVLRGKLIKEIPGGAMTSVPLTIEKLKPLLAADADNQLSISIDNGPTCIVGGPLTAVTAFEKHMKNRHLMCIRLDSDHALHSRMMEPISTKFREAVNKITLNSPEIPFISNVTGTWITDREAVDPGYWSKHLRETVRYSQGMAELLKEENTIFVEIGPGRALCTQLRQQLGKDSQRSALNFLRHQEEKISDTYYLSNGIGHLWLQGVKIDWKAFYKDEKRVRLPLPTYPFERQAYRKAVLSGLAIFPGAADTAKPLASPSRQPDISGWFYRPSWKRCWLQEQEPIKPGEKKTLRVLMFIDDHGLGSQLAQQLGAAGHEVITVKTGTSFSKPGGSVPQFILDPGKADHYEILFRELHHEQKMPERILHFWGVTGSRPGSELIADFDNLLDGTFYSLLFIAKALGKLHLLETFQLLAVTDNMQEVSGDEEVCPEKAGVSAIFKVIPQEYSNINCRSIDIILPDPGSKQREKMTRRLLKELLAKTPDRVVAFRGNSRWVQCYEHIQVHPAGKNLDHGSRLKKEGIYLITGGLGGVGHVLARYLGESLKAKLVLIGRTTLPARDQWQEWLSTHPPQDPVSLKIKNLQELEALGTEVLAINADVANEIQMQQAISRAEERFGNINGVIHCAGHMGENSPGTIDEINKNRCQEHFRPKVFGVLVLEKLLREKKLDFYLLMSSISAVLGGLGLAAYAAANCFMDAFTCKKNRGSSTWISVNWDGWRTREVVKEKKFSAAAWENFAMTPEEGIESFRRVLSMDEPGHLVHSTGDLVARINQWIKLEFLQTSKDSLTRDNMTPLHARPSLPNKYIPPRNELEKSIAEVWQNFLGIEQVGADDNFFDLHVTSLDILQVNSILKDKLKRDIPAATMFKYPTITSLANFLSQEYPIKTDAGVKRERKKAINQAQERMKKLKNRTMRTK